MTVKKETQPIVCGENLCLEIRGLSKAYPAFALKDVSFAVPQGAVMGFIGRNGAGKSTTLKSILGLVHPDGGEVRFFGKDFRENEQYVKENIGVVLGGIDFYPKKKVKTITEVTHRFYPRWDEEKYRHYLKLFSLDENKRVDQLSDGMKVKYLIALALSHDAKLLILDEPTSGLDPVSRDDLTELFSAVVADGTRSILFSTHITSDLEKCATHITYIRDGRILCSAEKSAFVAAFDHLRQGEEQLTLEEIMVRTERRGYDESAIV